MELLHWPSEKKWFLPSIDIESLELLAYIKFSSANVTTTPTFKSLVQERGRKLPCLCLAENETVVGNKAIINHLNLKHFNADTWLDEESINYSIVLKALIEDKLKPSVYATLWLDSSNYTDVIRPVFARNCRYPINFTESKKMHDQIDEFLSVSKHLTEENDEAVKLKLISKEGVEVVKVISEFLGNKDFLFGTQPCSVDALLFSCLAPLVKIPLSSGLVHNEVRKEQNLCQYVDRILQKYLKEQKKEKIAAPGEEKSNTKDSKEEKTNSSSKSTTSSTNENAEDDDYKFDWLLSVGVATVAMLSYAANAGLIHLRRAATN